MRFIFYHPTHFEDWDYRNSITTGIGGSETSQVEMAWRLVKRGHEVICYAPIPDDCSREWKGTIWKKLEEVDWKQKGIWILYRCPDALDNFTRKHEGQQLWLMMQDEGYGSWNKVRGKKVDKVLALCTEHARVTKKRHPYLADKVVITGNGVKIDLIREVEKQGEIKRNPYKLIYASSPDRGLKNLLKIFKRAKEFVPELELHVFYGFNNIDKLIKHNPRFKYFKKIKEEIIKLTDQPGVFMRGRISQVELYKEWLSAGMWCYSTNFTETSCITSMEAQCLGAIPITNPLWALVDNVKHGIFIEGDADNDPLTQARYAAEITRLALNPALQEALRKQMMLNARQYFNWERLVDQWESWVLKINPSVSHQWIFQRKHATGKILQLGSDGDMANFKSVGAVNLDVNKIHPTLKFDTKADILADARNLPKDLYNKFDTVIVGEMLEHMTHKDGIKTLENAKRCLKNNGKIIITCPEDSRNLKEDLFGAPVLEWYTKGVSGRHRLVTKNELLQIISETKLKASLIQDLDYTHFTGYGVVCY